MKPDGNIFVQGGNQHAVDQKPGPNQIMLRNWLGWQGPRVSADVTVSSPSALFQSESTACAVPARLRKGLMRVLPQRKRGILSFDGIRFSQANQGPRACSSEADLR